MTKRNQLLNHFRLFKEEMLTSTPPTNKMRRSARRKR